MSDKLIEALKNLASPNKLIDLAAEMTNRSNEQYEKNRWETHAFLDVDDKHPRLFGEAILLRDDDGMGFALNLERWRGEHVKIAIERVPTEKKRFW